MLHTFLERTRPEQFNDISLDEIGLFSRKRQGVPTRCLLPTAFQASVLDGTNFRSSSASFRNISKKLVVWIALTQTSRLPREWCRRCYRQL